MMEKFAIIKKLPSGKYRIFSHTGKHLGTYDSLGAAKKRLSQIEMFKHLKNKRTRKHAFLALKEIVRQAQDGVDFTYSAMIRHLRANHPEKVISFMKAFKEVFDAADKNKERSELEQYCLTKALDAIKD